MSFYNLLNDTVTIQSKSTTTNSWGEEVATWSTSTTSKARVYPLTEEMRMTLPGQFQDAEYKVILESSASITYNDKITWNNATWKILSIIEDSHSHHKEMLIKRLP